MFKRIVIGVVCVCVVAILGYTASTEKVVLGRLVSSQNVKSNRVIIIDAGHGGFDGGAVASDGTIEKELNLAIALKLDAVLKAAGFNTVMVRTTDTATDDPSDGERAKVSDIKNRVKLMNDYPNSIFVSVHMNKYSTTQPHGAQVFYSDFDGSKELALCIQSEVAEHVQTDNKRVIKPSTKDIYLLQHATVPAVIAECGFLSNPEDLGNLKNDDYQLKIATSLAFGIINYFKTDV